MTARSLVPPAQVFYWVMTTPLGNIGLAATEAGLFRIEPRIRNERHFLNLLKAAGHALPEKNPQFFKAVIKQLDRYFAGKLQLFDCKLDFSRGTAFQQKVWAKLLTIPYGKIRSYQWLAKSIGQPTACRAVGNANGKNPLSIIVPCHRVVLKSGGLGGYASGPTLKRQLLDLEQTSHEPV